MKPDRSILFRIFLPETSFSSRTSGAAGTAPTAGNCLFRKSGKPGLLQKPAGLTLQLGNPIVQRTRFQLFASIMTKRTRRRRRHRLKKRGDIKQSNLFGRDRKSV